MLAVAIIVLMAISGACGAAWGLGSSDLSNAAEQDSGVKQGLGWPLRTGGQDD